jgi:predicted RNA-binding Zn ribbon-like protein
MDQAGTIRTSDWKDGFLFVGNQLALDFVNTRPVQNGEPMELLPDFPALLRWFQATGLLTSREAANLQQQWGPSIRARNVLEAMRALRERLRKEILSWEGGGAVHHSTGDELNRLMAEHPMRTRLKMGTRTLDGIVVRLTETRRFVCSAGAWCRYVVRQRGSQSHPQV